MVRRYRQFSKSVNKGPDDCVLIVSGISAFLFGNVQQNKKRAVISNFKPQLRAQQASA